MTPTPKSLLELAGRLRADAQSVRSVSYAGEAGRFIQRLSVALAEAALALEAAASALVSARREAFERAAQSVDEYAIAHRESAARLINQDIPAYAANQADTKAEAAEQIAAAIRELAKENRK